MIKFRIQRFEDRSVAIAVEHLVLDPSAILALAEKRILRCRMRQVSTDHDPAFGCVEEPEADIAVSSSSRGSGPEWLRLGAWFCDMARLCEIEAEHDLHLQRVEESASDITAGPSTRGSLAEWLRQGAQLCELEVDVCELEAAFRVQQAELSMMEAELRLLKADLREKVAQFCATGHIPSDAPASTIHPPAGRDPDT